MENEYRLTTIKDIFDKIPADRLADCMDELKRLMILGKNTGEFAASLFEDVGISVGVTKFPDSIVWKDDGKKEITAGIELNGERLFSAQVKLK